MKSNLFVNLIAGVLLFIMFLLALFSIQGDSFTFDETAHIGAGYSYLTQKDYRLNPEHPPLIKDLAAFPLLFLGLNFPKDDPAWRQTEAPPWWMQFDFASVFLYKSLNNPDQILFWSRLMMILVLIFFGWFLFYFAKKFWGRKTALIALFLFSFSPTLLAHGRLITTDVGAALGVTLTTFFWLKFLKNPTKKNIIFAGLIFGAAMLLKFSLILLVPFFGLITLIYAWLYAERKKSLNILKYIGFSLLVMAIGAIFVIWPVYQYHVANFPPEHQMRDAEFLLGGTAIQKPLVSLDLWLTENPVLRPFGQYLLGLLLAINRSTVGNTTFFLGEISAAGWKTYFPIIYLIKEPLTLHILTVIVLLYLAWLIKKPILQETVKRAKEWAKNHFPELAMLIFLAIYWATSLNSKLNIGVRHLLPTFPFTILLVGYGVSLWLKKPFLKIKYAILSILIIWQVFSVVKVYPHFLAYFNELSGGPDKGYLYAVDSNLDWGQDLKRLAKWADDNKVEKIYLDYFGGGNAEYYLKGKFLPWWGKRDKNELPKGSYLAVSANQLQGGRALPVKGYDQASDYYRWLDKYTPIAKIGYSIFVYYIPSD